MTLLLTIGNETRTVASQRCLGARAATYKNAEDNENHRLTLLSNEL